MLTYNELSKIVKKKESDKLDFKRMIDLSGDKAKFEFAKDLVAIANAEGSMGYIIIGVDDKTKKVRGISQDSISEEQMQEISSKRCNPPVQFLYYERRLNNKNLGIIEIPKSRFLHQHRDTGAFHVRRGSTTGTLTPEEIRHIYEKKTRGTPTFVDKYARYGSRMRSNVMKMHCRSVFQKLEFDVKTYVVSYGDRLLECTNDTTKRKFRFFVEIHHGNLNKEDVINWTRNRSIVMRSVGEKRELKYRNLFMLLSYGGISFSAIQQLAEHGKMATAFKIDPNTFYYGLGKGAKVKSGEFYVAYSPKFYLQKIKSKEDMTSRLEKILWWMREEKDLLDKIRRLEWPFIRRKANH